MLILSNFLIFNYLIGFSLAIFYRFAHTFVSLIIYSILSNSLSKRYLSYTLKSICLLTFGFSCAHNFFCHFDGPLKAYANRERLSSFKNNLHPSQIFKHLCSNMYEKFHVFSVTFWLGWFGTPNLIIFYSLANWLLVLWSWDGLKSRKKH